MPVLTATGAGVRHRRRWLFRDLDVTVEPGELVAVVGPPGSGRTTVLLALARRFRLTSGKIQIAGIYFAKWRRRNGVWLVESETYVPERCTGGSYCQTPP